LKAFLLFLLFSASIASPAQAKLNALTDQGEKLFQFYQSLHVDTLWPAGKHVNWETGTPDDPNAIHDIKTHCSAFAASAGKRLGVYLLRPPEHVQSLLANAQAEWLKTDEAKAKGWNPVLVKNRLALYEAVQSKANEGELILAVVENPNPHKSGHVAMLLPFVTTADLLQKNGPRVLQSGTINSSSISMRDGFKVHLKEWPEQEVEFYEFVKPIEIPKT
jgi:hypothetical protein